MMLKSMEDDDEREEGKTVGGPDGAQRSKLARGPDERNGPPGIPKDPTPKTPTKQTTTDDTSHHIQRDRDNTTSQPWHPNPARSPARERRPTRPVMPTTTPVHPVP